MWLILNENQHVEGFVLDAPLKNPLLIDPLELIRIAPVTIQKQTSFALFSYEKTTK